MKTRYQHFGTPVILVLILIILCIPVHAQQFRAGASKRIITPDPLLPVSGGIGTPRQTLEKQGELSVRAVVFEKGEERVAIVSIDNLGWPKVLGDKARALIRDVPPENVIIGATHTHSAPDAYGFPDEHGNIHADLQYLEWCVAMMAEAVNEASDNLAAANVRIAVGEAKGQISYNYYAPQLYDPRCGVIQAVTAGSGAGGRVIATIVNYATHPEIVGADRGILTPDLCGPLYDKIEGEVGGVAIFMNSAQGGMVTADNRREGGKEANDWDECIRIGQLLGSEALRIVREAPIQENPEVYCVARTVEFPIESETMRYIIEKSPLGLNASTESVQTTMNLVNLGTAQILTIPGEALPNIGYYLKRNMKTEHPFLFGLTNDAFGYMMVKEDFDSFKRYEYISRTSLGEMTGEILIEESLQLISENPAPSVQ
jgi:hypothetical protein